jgi:hypothetical protein
MQKARLAAPITDAQIRLAQGFLRELDPDLSEIVASSSAITRCFARRRRALAALISRYVIITINDGD